MHWGAVERNEKEEVVFCRLNRLPPCHWRLLDRGGMSSALSGCPRVKCRGWAEVVLMCGILLLSLGKVLPFSHSYHQKKKKNTDLQIKLYPYFTYFIYKNILFMHVGVYYLTKLCNV